MRRRLAVLLMTLSLMLTPVLGCAVRFDDGARIAVGPVVSGGLGSHGRIHFHPGGGVQVTIPFNNDPDQPHAPAQAHKSTGHHPARRHPRRSS